LQTARPLKQQRARVSRALGFHRAARCLVFSFGIRVYSIVKSSVRALFAIFLGSFGFGSRRVFIDSTFSLSSFRFNFQFVKFLSMEIVRPPPLPVRSCVLRPKALSVFARAPLPPAPLRTFTAWPGVREAQTEACPPPPLLPPPKRACVMRSGVFSSPVRVSPRRPAARASSLAAIPLRLFFACSDAATSAPCAFYGAYGARQEHHGTLFPMMKTG